MKKYDIKAGDKVRMIKKRCGRTVWYCDEIYTVLQIDDKVAILDRNLYNVESLQKNKINIYYLKSLRSERKKKLLNLSK